MYVTLALLCFSRCCRLLSVRSLVTHLPTSKTVTVHSGQRVTLRLECDAHATSIPHLKALCLLDLVPDLNKLPSAALGGLLPQPPRNTSSSSSSGGASPGGGTDDLALVALVKTVRLENSKSGNALDESSTGASLFAARISDGTSLLLEWGAPPATGKALVKFYVRVGERDGCWHRP